MTRAETASSAALGVKTGSNWNSWGSSASFSMTYANAQSARNSNTEQREFSMRVFVRATQADMPPGTQKLLDVLTSNIAP